ncbi:DEAD/DEAH box helicase [Robiginitomaculum antarcticum]|uniref:DEAD/DEAH box helicase n=1 Tax=Robiginitomaculum antarcticum TaxID=437507 RepID=UPI000362AFEF
MKGSCFYGSTYTLTIPTRPEPARKPRTRVRRKAPNRDGQTAPDTATDAAPIEAAAQTPAQNAATPQDGDLPTFTELGLAPKILKALADKGYEYPTPIQAQSIPHALQGRDVLGIAQTGTGKTGAFILPVMHKLSRGRARARMPRCLVICPTRELAAQVAENVEEYGKYLKLEMALLIGGVSFTEQQRKLDKGVDILIATPGRLLDQFERGKILLTGVQTLIVDEADRMLDMGFIPDIERIFEITPFTRQVLFFSATMPPEITRLVQTFLHNPVRVEVARQSTTAKNVTQRIIKMPSNDARAKRNALRGIIEQSGTFEFAIIFCNRKRDVDIVAKSLNKHGLNAEPIHGDLPQSVRTQTLQDFRDGKTKILVASDVAARGLDVDTITHVLNYDVPNHAEDYVHRIGRTGRAGRHGEAIMLVSPVDVKNYEGVLHMLKKDSIEEMTLDGISLAADVRPGDKTARNKGRGRDRKSSRSPRGERRDRPVKDHGETASMAPVKKRRKPAAAKTDAPKTADAGTPEKPRDTTKRADSKRYEPRRDEAKAAPNKKAAKKPAPKSRNASPKGKSSFGDDVPSFLKQGF